MKIEPKPILIECHVTEGNLNNMRNLYYCDNVFTYLTEWVGNRYIMSLTSWIGDTDYGI